MRKGFNHRGDNTTSLCEGYHSAIKSFVRAQGGENVRVDRLIHHLLHFMADCNTHKDVLRFAGEQQPLHWHSTGFGRVHMCRTDKPRITTSQCRKVLLAARCE